MSAPRAPEADALTFSQQTVVEADPGVPGRYHAHIGPGWNAPLHPSGGLVTGVAMRAMQAAVPNPAHTPRTLTTLFASPVREGALVIDVEILRPGKRMTQLRANVRNADEERPAHVVTAAYGEAREGFDFHYTAPPDAGPPASYGERPEPPEDVPTFRAGFFDRTDMRPVSMNAPWEPGWEGGRAEATRWIRYVDTPRTAEGHFDPCALPGLADTMPPAVGQYIGPDVPFFHAPSVDLTLHVYGATRRDWLLSHARCHWAGDGYASAEIQLWDEDRRLVCHATQMMLLRFPDPESLGAR